MLPPYTAPPVGSAERAVAASGAGRHRSLPALSTGPASMAASRRAASASAAPGAGDAAALAGSLLPGRMDGMRRGDPPNLTHFRIPSWSTISSNPNARLYHSVALRRVAAAEHASATAEIGILMRRLAVLERMEQEEAAASRRMATASARRTSAANTTHMGGSGIGNGAGNESGGLHADNNDSEVFRPLEDPYLVGETAARRARSERLARESHVHGDDALLREDRRWDWFLGSFARPSTLPSSRRSVLSPSPSAGVRSSSSPRRHTRLHHPFLGH